MSASLRSSRKGTCPGVSAPRLPPALAGGKVSSLRIGSTILFGPARMAPAQATNSELQCNWHNSNLPMELMVRNLSLFWLTVPIVAWHASSGKSSFSVRLPLCPAMAHKPQRSAPCTVALKTLHLRFPELAHHVPRVPGCGICSFPFRWRRTSSRLNGYPDTSPSPLSSPQGAPGVPLAPIL